MNRNNKNNMIMEMNEQNIMDEATAQKPFKYFNELMAWAKKAGREACRPVVSLYFTLKYGNMPLSDKVMVYAALAYLVLPFGKNRLMESLLGGAVSVSIVVAKVRKYITPEIDRLTDSQIAAWFDKNTEEEVARI